METSNVKITHNYYNYSIWSARQVSEVVIVDFVD